MEVCMKDTLRALRQRKNVTQESLAKHLGITPQSVGKWERGEDFPDITLLPAIALYFGVTVDELLNVDRVRIDEKIKAYQDESHRLKNAGDNEKNRALWENAYAEFPNDSRVLFGLMFALNRDAVYPCPKEDAERIIMLGERILAESKDSRLREETVQKLCYVYESIGDRENALKYADMGGSMFTTRDDLRCHVLKGEEGLKESQEYLRMLILLAELTASSMIHKVDHTPEEAIAAYRFGIDLWKLLYSDGNIGFEANNLSRSYAEIAYQYAILKDTEGVLENLGEAARYAVMAATMGERKYTAPMVNRLIYNPEESTKNYKGNACNLRLNHMEWKVYDFVRENVRFKTIEERLKKYAE